MNINIYIKLCVRVCEKKRTKHFFGKIKYIFYECLKLRSVCILLAVLTATLFSCLFVTLYA